MRGRSRTGVRRWNKASESATWKCPRFTPIPTFPHRGGRGLSRPPQVGWRSTIEGTWVRRRRAMVVTREQNERLTRVGPGTPGGELLRRYWHPVAPVAELTE